MGRATRIAGIGSSGTSSNITPPGNVVDFDVSGIIDPITGQITLTVSITPLPGDPNFSGSHLYLEIPDISGGSSFTVGTSTLGSDPVTGTWAPMDLGFQVYKASQQPWMITTVAPSGIDPTLDTPCRLYVSSTSSAIDNVLHRATDPDPTPNKAFILVSLASGTPSAATNVTGLSGDITATVLPDDNTTGKLKTPILVMVSSIPTTPGWTAQLVITWGTADPTIVSNQSVVGPLVTQPGPVYGSPDGIPIPHTFALDTPKTITHLNIWLQAGLMDASGVYQWNNIVPGITPSTPVTIGTTTGTTDASSVMLATLQASMAVTSGLFGVAPSGITNSLLGPLAVSTINIQALAITNPLLASLCVQAANLANSSVTATAIANAAVGTAAIQTAAITNALIANAAVGTAQIQFAAVLGANIGFATIADSNIGTCNVSKLQAGTATFTGDVILQRYFGGPQVQLTSAAVILQNSGSQLTLNSGTAAFNGGGSSLSLSASLITLQSSSGPQLTFSSSAITMQSGGNQLQLTASQILLSGGGAQLTMTSSTITLKPTGGIAGVSVGSTGVATFTNSLGTSTSIDGNNIGCGQLFAAGVSVSAALVINPVGSISVGASATFTGTLADAISGGKSVVKGLIMA
jgi:hypothetical protein